jgi:hypothetical protein
MKGTVHKCIEKLITENFGRPTWEKVPYRNRL